MKIAIASIVRNGASYLPRYFAQVQALRNALNQRGDPLISVSAVGQSDDSSWTLMQNFALEMGNESFTMQHVNSGPVFGSVDHPVRWRHIAQTWNALFARIADRCNYDAMIYVEADLLWKPETMLALLAHLDNVPAVAPMSFLRAGFFYDTWGHRANGSHFGPVPPYHSALMGNNGELVKIDSAGSCKVMWSEVADVCRFSETDAMLGHDIYAKGFSLWLDPLQKVTHP